MKPTNLPIKFLARLVLLLTCSIASSSWAAPDEFVFEGSSNLPLIVIETEGGQIPDEPKVSAMMRIYHQEYGERNSLADEPSFESRIAIEVRGSSSQMFDKKSYGLELRNKDDEDLDRSLLGMSEDEDWILYGPYSDKTLIRNVLAFKLSNRIGRYAPRTRFVELFVVDGDDQQVERSYVGVYVLMERIKRGTDRVDVARMRPVSNDSSEYRGGYIVKIDRLDEGSSYETSDYGTLFGHVYPRTDRLDDAARRYIQRDLSRFEQSLNGDQFDDPNQGYQAHLDVDGFVDYLLLHELFKNVDSYFLSTFLHRNRDGRIAIGPPWDFNLSAGNAAYGGVWQTEGWMLDRGPQLSSGIPFWWDRLLSDPAFVDKLVQRWSNLRQEELSDEALIEIIDQLTDQLDEAQQRNFERWPILGEYIWPNPRPYGMSYEEEIDRLKDWLTQRTRWMDENIESIGAWIPPSLNKATTHRR